MAIEHTYQPLYVTELNEATLLSSTDWLLLSQKLSSDSSYLSKKVSILTVIDSFFENIDAASKSNLDSLSALVLKNINDIESNNEKLSNIISCLIKMANCILTNKSNISDVYELYKTIDNSVSNNDIDDSTKDNKKIAPSYRSIYDWCSNTFLKSAGFLNSTDFVNSILGMLNSETKYFYVNLENGEDSKNNGSIDAPFKTLLYAIDYANTMKFLENSECYIRIIGNYTHSFNDTIKVYHPDLVLTKNLYIEGYDTTTNLCSNINFIISDFTYNPKNNLDRICISINCKAFIRYINFYIEDYDNTNLDLYNENRTDLGSFFIASWNSSNLLTIDKCSFKGFYVAICAYSGNIYGSTFENCLTPIESRGNRITLYGNNFKDCYRVAIASYGCIILTNSSKNSFKVEYSDKSSVLSHLPLFQVFGGSNVLISLGYKYGYQFNDDDTWNTNYEHWFIQGISNLQNTIYIKDIYKSFIGSEIKINSTNLGQLAFSFGNLSLDNIKLIFLINTLEN